MNSLSFPGDYVLDSSRVGRIAHDPSLLSTVERFVHVARYGLPEMFDSARGGFVHSVHRAEGREPRRVGESVRYGAMVALGARWLDAPAQREIFGGETAAEFIERVASGADDIRDLGDLAAVAWAASSLACSRTAPLLKRLTEAVEARESVATVELAWSLSALVAGRTAIDCDDALVRISARLRSTFSHASGIFPHMIGEGARSMRDHVACFADQVYPIQALARYHACSGDPDALRDATRCAQQICDLQGPDGQWWWHYDSRTGRVIEGYPVYTVHQDAMGPMALFDLQEAGGPDFGEAIGRGVRWMETATEVGHSLISEDLPVIWRKVGRAEPNKLLRMVRAGTTRLHDGLRLEALDRVFPPTRIDYECRPYHLGWILDTWLAR